MSVIFCRPELTMKDTKDAKLFFEECRAILTQYIFQVHYMESDFAVGQALSGEVDERDIFIFFTSETGSYKEKFIKLITKYKEGKSRIWPVAMEANPECRRPPEPVSDRQSFDVACRKENRNPFKNNMRAIAQIFARKIISQTLSPLYRDEVLYFISHRRVDGEKLAGKLADQLTLLTRGRKVYRDVVNVAVGKNAQMDIDENLKGSDVLIFLQTKEAQHSKYIIKELCYALINDIPVLWIQIDGASYKSLEIRPGEAPLLCYQSEEFERQERLIEIAEEVEEKCFQLIMNCSGQVYSYIDCLNEMQNHKKIKLSPDKKGILAYEVEYRRKTPDIYDDDIRKHYIQCFGRNPQNKDIINFIERVQALDKYHEYDKLLLLSNHGRRNKQTGVKKICEDNYDDYIANIQYGDKSQNSKRNKRIILSGAFPDCDEIYKNSLMEAVVIYAREIIRNGYTLVFGAHPTFQKLIFDVGALYSANVQDSIEMHMDQKYMNGYEKSDLEKRCTLLLSDGLQEMREAMIGREPAELLICLGGKVKEDKAQQGVDIEVELAKKAKIPVALVGTVGGRSSEYAFEMLDNQKDWGELNPWGRDLNEALFYNVNHRAMANRLLEALES